MEPQAPALQPALFRALYHLGMQMADVLRMPPEPDEYGQLPETGLPQLEWTVSGLEMLPYATMAERHGQEAFWGIYQFTEQAGGVLFLLSMAGVQALLGGDGNEELDDEAIGIVDNLLARVADLHSQAWAEIAAFEGQLGTFPEAPTLEELQEVVPGLAPATPMVCTSFRIRTSGRATARLVVALPQPLISPLDEAMEAVAELTWQTRDDSAASGRLAQLGDTPVRVLVTLGSTTLTLAELQNLERDDLLVLDQLVVAPLSADVGGATIRVSPGTTPDGLRRAVQVVRLERDD